jgi:SAM-dependent methyltransferase
MHSWGARPAPAPAGPGYAGDTRCALPLPLANESVNAIVLQHVTAADADRLLDECERVLMPGGHLWLSSLNPFSPYRTRWRQHGLVVRTPRRIRLLLGRHGLECDDMRYLGPLWRGAGSRRPGVGPAARGLPVPCGKTHAGPARAETVAGALARHRCYLIWSCIENHRNPHRRFLPWQSRPRRLGCAAALQGPRAELAAAKRTPPTTGWS